ncbi:MAG: sialate O-acetylesterase [Phycisphaerae bacterium]|nr:sialate O-acetylesterase [Phycisphaerae bacterium]
MSQSKRWVLRAAMSLFVAGIFLISSPVSADVRLPHIIGSHMVLQQDKPLPIWGWADPGEKVTVKLGDREKSATTNEHGRWAVRFPAMKAGGPIEMTVSGKNTLKLTDILIGEVWVCSGQSNMEMGVGPAANGKEEIAAAKHPNIRLFQVPHRPSGLPESDIDVPWEHCTPESVARGDYGGFSAAGYYFGRALQKELNVPIGLIDTSWGGTRIEPWTPPEGFASVPALRGICETIAKANQDYFNAVPKAVEQIAAWVPVAKKDLEEGKRVSPPPGFPNHALNSHGQPTGLYNGMVQPIVPFAIRGAIWYQGESNRGEGMLYFEKMKALIDGWRKVWAEGDFPFYFVQLAPFRYQGDVLALPMIWEAQNASLAIPNTGMCVTVDIVANIADIHPINKQDVGKRLALWALAKTYGKEGLVYSGPLYKSMAVDGNKARITFDHVGGGFVSRDGKPLTHFQVAGEDKKFVDAKAEIDGATVVVSSDQVAKPVAVRFGWHQEAQPNLSNKEGLPASPFRTDRW